MPKPRCRAPEILVSEQNHGNFSIIQTPPPSRVKTFLLERIIEASARNNFLVFILTMFAIAGGIWALDATRRSMPFPI